MVKLSNGSQKMVLEIQDGTFDLDTGEILDDIVAIGEMHAIIECEPTTEEIGIEKSVPKDCKKKVRSTSRLSSNLNAPMGTKPRLVCGWLQLKKLTALPNLFEIVLQLFGEFIKTFAKPDRLR